MLSKTEPLARVALLVSNSDENDQSSLLHSPIILGRDLVSLTVKD
jgi:hypothetical protein